MQVAAQNVKIISGFEKTRRTQLEIKTSSHALKAKQLRGPHTHIHNNFTVDRLAPAIPTLHSFHQASGLTSGVASPSSPSPPLSNCRARCSLGLYRPSTKPSKLCSISSFCTWLAACRCAAPNQELERQFVFKFNPAMTCGDSNRDEHLAAPIRGLGTAAAWRAAAPHNLHVEEAGLTSGGSTSMFSCATYLPHRNVDQAQLLDRNRQAFQPIETK